MPSRRTKRILTGAAVAVGAAALAFGIGRFTAFQTEALPNEADLGFARDMQTHHAQAVEMAMSIYRTTDDAELRAVSYDIGTGQAAQRGQMAEWIVQWGVSQLGDETMAWMSGTPGHDAHVAAQGAIADAEDLRELMGMASDAELAALDAATGLEANCSFLGLMIRHHEGALTMIDAVVERGSLPRVVSFAQSMGAAQASEIDMMRSIQTRLACTG